MAPQILHRVIKRRTDTSNTENPSSRIKIRPAILHGYQRRRVRWADYPGIIPASISPSTSTNTTDTSTSTSTTSVLGTLVTNLTASDVERLDSFEGSDYIKKPVTVRLLQESFSMGGRQESSVAKPAEGHIRDVLDAARAEVADEGEEVEALTYVFIGGEDNLEDKEWDFEAFKKDRLAWWVGADEREL